MKIPKNKYRCSICEQLVPTTDKQFLTYERGNECEVAVCKACLDFMEKKKIKTVKTAKKHWPEK